MSIEDNKAIVRRAVRVGPGDDSTIDQLFAPDYTVHFRRGDRPDLIGIDAFRSFLDTYSTAFPDQQWTLEDLVAEGDKVVVLWTLHATHKGELMGIPPTGRAVTMSGISVFRIADGKLVEDWTQSDTLGLLQQLGAGPM